MKTLVFYVLALIPFLSTCSSDVGPCRAEEYLELESGKYTSGTPSGQMPGGEATWMEVEVDREIRRVIVEYETVEGATLIERYRIGAVSREYRPLD